MNRLNTGIFISILFCMSFILHNTKTYGMKIPPDSSKSDNTTIVEPSGPNILPVHL